jgi:hypothetical protein
VAHLVDYRINVSRSGSVCDVSHLTAHLCQGQGLEVDQVDFLDPTDHIFARLFPSECQIASHFLFVFLE